MTECRFVGACSGLPINVHDAPGRTNVVSVYFKPIDQSHTRYATYLTPNSVRTEIRRQRPPRCRVCLQTGHDRRTCPKRKAGGS